MKCRNCHQLLIIGSDCCGYCGSPVEVKKKLKTSAKILVAISFISLGGSFLLFSFFLYKYQTTIALKSQVGLITSPLIDEKEVLDQKPTEVNKPEEVIRIETKNAGETYVDFDNVYDRLELTSKTAAQQKIIADSLLEKNNCPNNGISVIEQSIINNYSIMAVNLCEMDLAFARELEQVVATVYNDFPNARGYLTNLTLTNTTLDYNYLAIFYGARFFASANSRTSFPWVYKTLIGLNSYYYLNEPFMQSEIELAALSGYFPLNATKTTPLAHEFGHYLSFLVAYQNYQINSLIYVKETEQQALTSLFNDWDKGITSLKIIEKAYQNYLKKYDKISLLDFRASISSYALAVDENKKDIYDETIAEAFHDYYINKTNAALASQEIVAVLKERLS